MRTTLKLLALTINLTGFVLGAMALGFLVSGAMIPAAICGGAGFILWQF